MEINIPVKIHKTDYVLFNTVMEQPVEGFDTIYSAESVIDCINNGFRLEEDEQFIRLIDLPKDVLIEYGKQIAYAKANLPTLKQARPRQ